MKASRKSNITLFILILAAGTAYKVPYLKAVFYDELVKSLNVSNSELGMLTTVYATVKMIVYIPCGIIADRLNPRKVLMGSLCIQGLLTAVYAMLPDIPVLQGVHALYAVVNVFFWTSFIKGIRILGEEKNQGKVFGFSEGFRGIAGSVTTFISLRIVDTFVFTDKPLSYVLLFYTFIYIAMGIALYVLFPDKKDLKVTMSSYSLKSYIAVFRMPAIWVISLLIFTTYSMQIAFEYTTTYLTQIIGMSVVSAGIVATFRDNICGIAGSPTAGILADRLHSPSRIARILIAIEIVLSVAFLLMPSTRSFMIPIILFIIIFSVIHYGVRGTYYSSMAETGVPIELTATATSVVAVFGYTPDIFMHLWCGKIMDSYPADVSFKIIFLLIVLFTVLSFVVICVLRLLHRKGDKFTLTS